MNDFKETSAGHTATNRTGKPVQLIIRPHEKDLGEFTVRRSLPAREKRMVGPFVFFDHMGPATFPGGQGIDVRPHPHIGIATVTYLFDGEIMHRDSLGYVQPIRPGAVNLMVAGRGIVHSERTGDEERAQTSRLHGIQLWLALPAQLEETDPEFIHYPAADIPSCEINGVTIRVVMGSVFGETSPVKTLSPTIYAELAFGAKGDAVDLSDDATERAIYVVEGAVSIGDTKVESAQMAVLTAGTTVKVSAAGPARVMLLGGEPFPEARHIWWNLVSSRRERIEQAKTDWKAGRFAKVPGDDEFIPLPEK